MHQQIKGATVIGVYPSWNQDVIYAVNQLVAVALRALSPSINDPFLAMSCIDRLGAALIRLAQKSLPSSYRYDETGRLRLLETLSTIAGVVERAERKAAILHQGEMIKRAGKRSVDEKFDQKDIQERYKSLKRILDGR